MSENMSDYSAGAKSASLFSDEDIFEENRGGGEIAEKVDEAEKAEKAEEAEKDPGNVPSDEKDEFTFKEGLEELEGIVHHLESGELELEESLTKYQRGVELLHTLQDKIAGAEQKVTVLLGEIEPETDESIDERLS